MRPFLQASFALHGRRVVPYYEYPGWELRQRPLSRFDMEPDEFVKAVSGLVITGSLEAQATVLQEAERVFRSEG